MRKLITSLLLATATSAQAAGGPLDGIYSCNANVGGDIRAAYVTINGYPNGSSILVVAAVSPSSRFYGYASGLATYTSFSGTTMFNLPFYLQYSAVTNQLYGSIGIVENGTVYYASTVCTKIF